MTIIKAPFRRYNEETPRDNITVNLNTQERQALEEAKALLNNPMDSSVMKKVFYIGLYELQREKIQNILELIYEEKRKAKARGDL